VSEDPREEEYLSTPPGKIYKAQSLLRAPWWNVQARMAHRRIQRYTEKELAKLSPEARVILDKIHDDELDRHLGM
jgi:hypothetical protein